MGCTHTDHCPLFPYLNASLAGWRDVYCDSATRWRDCARFKLSRTGEPVPLALLPNGKLPVAMLPNVTRSESIGLRGHLGPFTLPNAPTHRAPTPPAPVPASPPQPFWASPQPPPDGVQAMVDSYLAPDWRRPVRVRRWIRILRWLRAPA
jgi:hypothetical protein